MRFSTRLLCISLTLLVLAGCKPEPRTTVDRQKILSEMKGPEIQGIKSALLDQAEDALKIGDTRRAQQMYSQLVDTNPDNLEYKIKLGEMQRRNGNFDEAIATFNKVLGKQGDNVDALEGKALAQMAKGDVASAGALFGQVLKKDNTRWRTLNAVGILFSVKGMMKEAFAYYEEALKYSPDSPAVLNNMALTQALNREYDQAIELFQKARTKLPADSRDLKRIDMNLALTYGISGRMDEAQKISEQYLSPEQVYNNMGFYAMLNKDNALAKTYLNMALSQSTKYYEKAWNTLEIVTGAPGNPGQLPSFSVNPAPAATPSP